MRYLRLGSVLFGMLALAGAHTAEARTELPLLGSSGAAFTDECPAGQYLVGLNGRRSEYVDQVQIICATIGADGKFGPELHYGPERGGRTGTPLESACHRGVVPAIEVAMAPSNRQVFDVRLRCRSVRDGQLDTVSFVRSSLGGGRVFGPQYDQRCPDGEVGIGIRGRADDYVAAVGLICEANLTVAANAPDAGGGGGKAALAKQAEGPNKGLFAAPFATESSLGGKFDIKLEIVDVDEKAGRYKLKGTLKNTDIGPEYNGTFDGTMSPNQVGIVQLTYRQPGSGQGGSVVFTFSDDGETVTGDGIHQGNLPFKWNGKRKD